MRLPWFHGRLAILVVLIALVASACQQAVPTVTETTESAPVPTATTAATVAPAAPLPTVVATATPEPGPTPATTVTAVPTPVPTPTPLPGPLVDEAFAMSALETVPCPAGASAAQVTCSVASVPLDILNPEPGEMIEVMIAFVDNGNPQGIGPVAYLQGGPGVGSVASAARFVGGSHDLYFVDQRGTGFSTPKLDCPEVDDLWVGEHTDAVDDRLGVDDESSLDAYQRCKERLTAEGIALDTFNTGGSAGDLELIRRLLGHEQWSLWGVSYGTRLALTTMRDYPDGIRSAVLDSVVPFEVDFFATLPENALRAVLALDAACDAERCSEDHGDFYTNLVELTVRLNEEPAVVTVRRPSSGDTFPFRVDGDQLLALVFTQLYSTSALRSLPRQIARAEFGGIEELVVNYARGRDPQRFDLAEAMYYTTWCREEIPFHDVLADDQLLAELRADFGSAFDVALSSDGTSELCDIFSVPSSDQLDDQSLISDIPTLVFAGSFDPITPPAWSKQVADALTNATYVELPNHGHGMTGGCTRDIRVAFLVAPNETLNTDCVNAIEAPDFD